MAAGQILTQADFCNQVAAIAIRVNTLLSFNVPSVQQRMLALGAAGIVALPAPSGFAPLVTADANALMNAMNELNDLAACYVGTKIITAGGSPGSGATSVGNGHDFRNYPSNIWGFGYQTLPT